MVFIAWFEICQNPHLHEYIMVLSVALFDSSAGLARGLGPDEFGLVFIKMKTITEYLFV